MLHTPVHHSTYIRSEASAALRDPFASAREKSLAASILGGSGHEMHPTNPLKSFIEILVENNLKNAPKR